jgi:hypothetical protein
MVFLGDHQVHKFPQTGPLGFASFEPPLQGRSRCGHQEQGIQHFRHLPLSVQVIGSAKLLEQLLASSNCHPVGLEFAQNVLHSFDRHATGDSNLLQGRASLLPLPNPSISFLMVAHGPSLYEFPRVKARSFTTSAARI